MKHSYVAYRSGKCRCDAICRPDHNARRQQERADAKARGERYNARNYRLNREGTELTVDDREMAVMKAFLKDGCDSATVARRVGVTQYAVTQAIKNVMRGGGYSNRTELAVAILRRHIRLVPSTTHSETLS